MLDEKDLAFVERYKGTHMYGSDHILGDFLQELQRMLELSFAIEETPKEFIPKITLGSDKSEDKRTDMSTEYHPQLFVSLSKRKYVNEETGSRKMFEGNIISGAKNFRTDVELEDELGKYKANGFALRTDNEFKLTLKTKTIKEQIIILAYLERALTIYARMAFKSFITLSGIDTITTDEQLDKDELYTLKILYHTRMTETLIIDDKFILKFFEIAFGESEGLDGVVYESGTEEKEELPIVTFP